MAWMVVRMDLVLGHLHARRPRKRRLQLQRKGRSRLVRRPHRCVTCCAHPAAESRRTEAWFHQTAAGPAQRRASWERRVSLFDVAQSGPGVRPVGLRGKGWGLRGVAESAGLRELGYGRIGFNDRRAFWREFGCMRIRRWWHSWWHSRLLTGPKRGFTLSIWQALVRTLGFRAVPRPSWCFFGESLGLRLPRITIASSAPRENFRSGLGHCQPDCPDMDSAPASTPKWSRTTPTVVPKTVGFRPTLLTETPVR
jgi:hypothetical protein